jgi:hypothetical protein
MRPDGTSGRIGYLDGTPVAAAASHAAHGVVNLCLAATLPAAQRRGVWHARRGPARRYPGPASNRVHQRLQPTRLPAHGLLAHHPLPALGGCRLTRTARSRHARPLARALPTHSHSCNARSSRMCERRASRPRATQITRLWHNPGDQADGQAVDHNGGKGSPFNRSSTGQRRAESNRLSRHPGAVASTNVGYLLRVAPLRWRPRTADIARCLQPAIVTQRDWHSRG